MKYPWGKRKTWPIRNEIVASFIGDEDVIDFGAGYQGVKKFMGNNRYIPIDLAKVTPETIIFDINKDNLKDLNIDVIPKNTIAICQGIIEYLAKPIQFLEDVGVYADKMVLTYNESFNFASEHTKRRLNYFRKQDIPRILQVTGWRIWAKRKLKNMIIIYCIKKPYEKR